MIKLLPILFAVILSLVFCVPISAREWTDFIGKKIAVQVGDNLDDREAYRMLQTKNVFSFQEFSELLEAVRAGRVDAALKQEMFVNAFRRSERNNDLEIIYLPEELFYTEDALVCKNAEICAQFNEFLAKIRADGTLDEMNKRWFSISFPDTMPKIELTGINGTLITAGSAGFAPMSFIGRNNEIVGFQMETMQRFAQFSGKNLEWRDMSYGAILPFVVAGRADISAASFDLTEERRQNAIMSDGINKFLAVLVVKRAENQTKEPQWQDFIGKKFATMVGSVFDKVASDKFNAAKIYYDDNVKVIQGVFLGKADAALMDEVVAKLNLGSGNFPGVATILLPFKELEFDYGVFSMNQNVIDQYNAFLRKIKEDGVYDEMVDRWFSGSVENIELPEIEIIGANTTLRVAINSAYPPFCFLGKNNTFSGFDIEKFLRFGQFIGANIEFIPMEFAALIPFTVSGKADIASSIYITEERRKSVIFSEPNFVSKTALVYKEKKERVKVEFAFINWLKTGFERNLITENRWKLVVAGLQTTMLISFLAQIFATILGALICFLLLQKNRVVKYSIKTYEWLIHGTPMVVLLLIFYYIIFGTSDISPIFIAIAAFSMVVSVDIGGNLCRAINNVDKTEIEAARSLGFSRFGAFMSITFPQAVKEALPAYMNGFVELVKATAIVGFIAIQDLSRAGDIIRSRTYDAYFPLLFVALVYLTVTTICILLFKFIVAKINERGRV